jgi:hypothetical protein
MKCEIQCNHQYQEFELFDAAKRSENKTFGGCLPGKSMLEFQFLDIGNADSAPAYTSLFKLLLLHQNVNMFLYKALPN